MPRGNEGMMKKTNKRAGRMKKEAREKKEKPVAKMEENKDYFDY